MRDCLPHSGNFSLRCLYCSCLLRRFSLTSLGTTLSPRPAGGGLGGRPRSFPESPQHDRTPTGGSPHLNRHVIDLSPFFVSSSTLCHLWVLGFVSQIHYMNPSLCLGIFFWGTQTETIIYCGQQVPNMHATHSIPVLLTDMPVDHGFFPLNLENNLEFSEQPLGAAQYWHVG